MSIHFRCRKRSGGRIRLVASVMGVWFSTAHGAAATFDLEIILPERGHPYLAATGEELMRIRKAYRGRGPEQGVAAAYVTEAEQFADDPIMFAARGGQHNQWYQCDACETALRTIDTTHHQCPRCGKVYSGPPYDDVIFSRQHGRNLQNMLTAAWAYAISGGERFAEYSAKILLGYAERYSQYPYHSASRETQSSWGRKAGGHLYEQTLTEASALARSIGPAYDLIHDSGVLSATDHKRIREGLLRPMLRNIDRNKAGKSNWQTWHNAAMIWGGALVREPAWIRKAIADPENGFHRQMEICVSKEGMWYENSWGYHFYTLQALVNMAETGRRLGINLWSNERLERMFTLPIQYTMPNGMLPRFGDDVNSSVRRVSDMLEPAYHAYKDSKILPILSDRATFGSVLLGRDVQREQKLPLLESAVFEEAGHAILRSRGKGGLTAALTFGPYGGFHGHYDKLSFVFYGFGKELAVDPGRARSQAYRLPIHGNWYKATISHNTVLVDGQSQQPAAGELQLFETSTDYTVVQATCSEAYPQVNHTRWCILTGTYLLVVDRLDSDRERRTDWLYHNRSRRVLCDVARDPVDLSKEYPGGEYVQDATRGATDKMVQARFEDSDLLTYLTLCARPETDVTLGAGVGASIGDRVPMVMIGRRGRQVFFAAVLEPVPSNKEPEVGAVRFEQADQTLAVTVDRGNRSDVVRITPDERVLVALAR